MGFFFLKKLKIKLPKIKQIRLIITGLKQTGPAEKRDIG